jgi:DNA-binding NarL/FixJ family response regulator
MSLAILGTKTQWVKTQGTEISAAIDTNAIAEEVRVMALQTQVSAFDDHTSGSDGSYRPPVALHNAFELHGGGSGTSHPDPLWAAALEAHKRSVPPDDLRQVWPDMLDGRFTVMDDKLTASRHFVLGRAIARSRPLSRVETAVLVRVLNGEQQKVIAFELGIACSTASKWYTQALATLNLDGGPVPLAIVLAAQTWASGTNPGIDARWIVFEHEGNEFFLLSVPRPSVKADSPLTLAERAVAQLLIEGRSRWEIAVLRSTSAQTVACQLRGIFAKFQLTGRYASIRHAAELGWFR